MANTLEHTGAEILEPYYPQYAEQEQKFGALYDTKTYIGSTIILLSMCVMGLPITAFAYAMLQDSSELYTWGIISAVVTAIAFAVGMVMTAMGLKATKKHGLDQHH